MRRLLVLPVAAAVGVLVAGYRAPCQQPDDFGVLKPASAASSKAKDVTPSPRTVPAGVEPIRPTTPTSRVANPYPLTPDVLGWMICAATYLGPDGPELAKQVATELRTKHRIAAYIFNRGDEERRKQEEEHQERLKRLPPGVTLPRKVYRVQDQYAVLIGGFKDVDAASKYLPTFKKLPPPTLHLDGGRSPYELMTYQDVDPETKKPVTKTAKVNPFHNAIVVRNPLAPVQQVAKPKWDPLWKKLNGDEEYSLLNNPKKFSLLVKEYHWARAFQQQKGDSSFLNAMGLGGARGADALDASAMQAHELAKFLRHPSIGLKAWVLHTRSSSLVCVGGFDGPEDPEFGRAKQHVANVRFTPKNGGTDPVGLLAEPVPIEIPRP